MAARRAASGIRCDLRGLDDLGQDAAGGGGMQERDLRAADAGARRLVDQPQPAARAAAQRRVDVVHLVGDVVQTRALAWPGTARPACPRASGASSSTWLSPTSSSTASTPCSATVSRCTSGMP